MMQSKLLSLVIPCYNEEAVLPEIIKRLQVFCAELTDLEFVDGWYQNPEYQLLAGIPATPTRTDTPQLLLIQDYQQRASNVVWEEYKKRCAQEIYFSSQTLLCWLSKP